MSMKTNKAFTKRIKITKTGKMISRAPGQNHFNARSSRVKQLNGRKGNAFTTQAKTLSRMIPYAKNK